MMGVHSGYRSRRLARFGSALVLGLLLLTHEADAQSDLSASDAEEIGTSAVDAAERATKALPGRASQDEARAVLTAAVADCTRAAIRKYGPYRAMWTAEAIERALEQERINPAAIGAGLAMAALTLEPLSGLQVADAVGAANVVPVRDAFQRTAIASDTEYGEILAYTVSSHIPLGR